MKIAIEQSTDYAECYSDTNNDAWVTICSINEGVLLLSLKYVLAEGCK